MHYHLFNVIPYSTAHIPVYAVSVLIQEQECHDMNMSEIKEDAIEVNFRIIP